MPRKRSLEDAACCEIAGGGVFRRYTVPDNIYRYFPGTDEPVVKENDDQFKPLEPGESYLIPSVTDFIRNNLSGTLRTGGPTLYRETTATMSLPARVAERTGLPLWYYADYPYLIYGEHSLVDWLPSKAREFSFDISPAGLKAWQDGFACQRSQIPLLYVDENDMRSSIEKYLRSGFGSSLWQC